MTNPKYACLEENKLQNAHTTMTHIAWEILSRSVVMEIGFLHTPQVHMHAMRACYDPTCCVFTHCSMH